MWTVPAVSNLFVEAQRTKKDLLRELWNLAKDFHSEFGLLITPMDVREISRQHWRTEIFDEPGVALPTGPVVAYKVHADDRRMEPVRGLAFYELSIRTLRDIYALGKEPALTNMGHSVARTCTAARP